MTIQVWDEVIPGPRSLASAITLQQARTTARELIQNRPKPLELSEPPILMPLKWPVPVAAALASRVMPPLTVTMLDPLPKPMFCVAVSETLPVPLVAMSEFVVLRLMPADVLVETAVRLLSTAMVTGALKVMPPATGFSERSWLPVVVALRVALPLIVVIVVAAPLIVSVSVAALPKVRSEERRVGKECA